MPKGHHAFASRSAVSLPKKVPVACVRHPAGAGQMAVMDPAAAFRFAYRIEAEQHLHGFFPVSAIGSCIEQAHIKLNMRPVVFGEFLPYRRDILERLGHDTGPDGKRSLNANQGRSELEILHTWGSSAAEWLARDGRSLRFASVIVNQQHSLATVGREEDDARGLKRPAHLVPCCLVHKR